MKYTKPPLTHDQQADLLLKRGLEADRDTLIERLRVVNYYRLSGYLYPFRNADDSYRPGTTLERVWRRYTFDRRLRLILLDAIERVEVAVKTDVVYNLSHKTGPFGYTRPGNLPKLNGHEYGTLLARLDDETQRSKEAFVVHFRNKYGDQHRYPPLWMAVEIMTFGSLYTLFKGVSPDIKQAAARPYGVPDTVLFSWLGAINVIRNICAHHGRMWNRELGFKPIIPKERKYPDWHHPVRIANNRVFGLLTILRYMVGVAAPQSHWPDRLIVLLAEYGDVPLSHMGFPPNWTDCPIWKARRNIHTGR